MGYYFIRIRCAYSGTTTKKITKQVQKLDKKRVKRKMKKTKHQPGGTTARRAGTTARTQAAAPDVLPLKMKTCVEFQAAVLPPPQRYYRQAQITVLPPEVPLEVPARPKTPLDTPTVPPGTRFVLPPASAFNPSGTTAGAAVLPLDLGRFGLKPM
jgi:hypothetical protein